MLAEAEADGSAEVLAEAEAGAAAEPPDRCECHYSRRGLKLRFLLPPVEKLAIREAIPIESLQLESPK